MLRRLALLTLLGVVSACDAPPQATPPAPPPIRESAPAPLSEQRIRELSGRCERKSREGFRREWRDGAAATAQGQLTAEFAHHYNTKLDTCFYLLTVASSNTLRKSLIDINENEIYGEYLGPASADARPGSTPDTCRVVDMYCASEREWEVLVGAFMEYE